MEDRRSFIKKASLAASAFTLPYQMKTFNPASFQIKVSANGLQSLAENLLTEWADALLSLQVNAPGYPMIHGGLLCPAHGIMHGRSFDCMSSWLYMYEKTKKEKYLNAALNIYDWTNNNMSQPDGAWRNDYAIDWKGITVFGAATLGHCIQHYESLLTQEIITRFKKRLKEAADFIFYTFKIGYSNINYPASAIYTLWLCGSILNEEKYHKRADELKDLVMPYITPNDNLIFGEGSPYDKKSDKGRYPVDLGYNVEETLQSLFLYALEKNDIKFKEKIISLLHSHVEFMLPDGSWDNGWGTRQFKWSYWGSRTSDGSLPAYALASEQQPVFYKAAFLNLNLLKECTHKGILTGGPHYDVQGLPPCLHHTFCHLKGIETFLKHKKINDIKDKDITSIKLPREQEYGIKYKKDIGTWLVAKGDFIATITDNDWIYNNHKNGHPSGGSISALYHKVVGPLLMASMNEYDTSFEPVNMQNNNDPYSIPLTPAIVMKKDGEIYRSNNDLSAKIITESEKNLVISSEGILCDVGQKLPGVLVKSIIHNRFQKDAVIIEWKTDLKEGFVFFSLPLISKANEKYEIKNNECIVYRGSMKIVVQTNGSIKMGSSSNGRIFNNVPGFQAVPLEFYADKSKDFCRITIEVFKNNK